MHLEVAADLVVEEVEVEEEETEVEGAEAEEEVVVCLTSGRFR